MKYVLDTNVVSGLMKGDPRVLDNLRRASRRDVAVPQPALAEIAYGISRLPRSRRRDRLAQRYRLIREELVRAPWTDEVSQRYGEIKAALERRGDRIEDFDAAIAAHALAAEAALVTADRHLLRIPGLTVVDWGRAAGEE